MQLWGTKEVARLLGVRPNLLQRAIWNGQIDTPSKGPGGAFMWTVADIERASWRLLHKPFDAAELEGASDD